MSDSSSDMSESTDSDYVSDEMNVPDDRSRIKNMYESRFKTNHKYANDSSWYHNRSADPCFGWKQIYKIIQKNDLAAFHNAVTNPKPDQRIPLDIHDRYYKTPLMIAAAQGNVNFVEYRVDALKFFVLNHSVLRNGGKQKRIFRVKILYIVSNGGDVNAIDNFGWTALHHACTAPNPEQKYKKNSEKTQKTDGDDVSEVTSQDVVINNSPAYKIVKILLENEVNINQATRFGATPLIRAIQSNAANVVELLLQNGADVMITVKQGKSK